MVLMRRIYAPSLVGAAALPSQTLVAWTAPRSCLQPRAVVPSQRPSAQPSQKLIRVKPLAGYNSSGLETGAAALSTRRESVTAARGTDKRRSIDATHQTMGLCLVAVFAITALASGSASAAPEYFGINSCTKKFGALYNGPICVTGTYSTTGPTPSGTAKIKVANKAKAGEMVKNHSLSEACTSDTGKPTS